MPLDDFNEPSYFHKLEKEATNSDVPPNKKPSSSSLKWIVGGLSLYMAINIFAAQCIFKVLRQQSYSPQQIETALNAQSQKNAISRAVYFLTKPGRELAYRLHQP